MSTHSSHKGLEIPKGGFPLLRKILRAFYVPKNMHVNSFHCCVKSFCCTAFFYICLLKFSPYKRLGPWVEKEREFDLNDKNKNGGSSEQAFAPFLPSPEVKEKAKIQKKVLDKGYISKSFST